MPKSRQKINVNLNDKKERLFAQLPKSLKAAIVKASERAGRSISAEVTLRLAHSLKDYEFIPSLPDFEEGH